VAPMAARPIIRVYDRICNASCRFTAPDIPGGWHVSLITVAASVSLVDDAARLLRDALWRPRLILVTRWWRLWRLRRKAIRLYEDGWSSTLPPGTYQAWLKDDKASKKAARKAARRQKSVAEETYPSARVPRHGAATDGQDDRLGVAVSGRHSRRGDTRR